MTNNNLAAELKLKLGSTLDELKKVREEEKKIIGTSKELTKEQTKALRELKKRYTETARDAGKLQGQMGKLKSGVGQVEGATKKAGKSGMKMGEMMAKGAQMATAGLAAALTIAKEVLGAMDQIQKAHAGMTAERGDYALRLSTALSGMGITGQAQEDVTAQVMNMGGPAMLGERVAAVEAMVRDTMDPDELLSVLGSFTRAGGNKGKLGGDALGAMALMASQFDSFQGADRADVALMFQENAGGTGFSRRAAKSANQMSTALGAETALAVQALFTRASMDSEVAQLVAALADNETLDNILSGKSKNKKLNMSVAAVSDRVGGDLHGAVRNLAGDFASVRGRDYVGERLAGDSRAAREQRAFMSERNQGEIIKNTSLGPREREYKRLQVQQFIDEVKIASARGNAAETYNAKMMQEQLDQFGANYVMERNEMKLQSLEQMNANYQGYENIQASRQTITDVRIVEDSSRSLSPAALEDGGG